MAVRHGYGKIAGTDALVFAYDTGDTRNSYKGEPTVNYISFRNAVAQDNYTSYVATTSGTWQEKHPDAIKAYNIDGTEITQGPNTGVGDWTNTYHCIHALDPELNRPVAVMRCFDSNWKAHNFNTNMAAWNTYGISAGDQYTISWLQWTTDLSKSADTGLYTRNSSNSRNFWDGRSGTSATAKNTKVRTWQRVYKTFTVSANRDLTDPYALIYQYGHQVGPNTNGVILKVTDVQLELKGHPTPFTGNSAGTSGITTRSTTQGLLDLTGNNTIDLSNVSFDSNAQKTFDGTDDIVNLGSSLDSYNTPTIEAVFKSNSASGTNFKVIIGWGAPSSAANYSGVHLGSGTSAYPDESLTVWVNGQTLQMAVRKGHGYYHDDKYHHVVVTLAPGANKIYIDGVEETVAFRYGSVNTDSGGFSQTNNITYIGRRSYSSNYFFNGSIPLLKIYNRALTPSEVQSNYRHYKKRFNI